MVAADIRNEKREKKNNNANCKRLLAVGLHIGEVGLTLRERSYEYQQEESEFHKVGAV